MKSLEDSLAKELVTEEEDASNNNQPETISEKNSEYGYDNDENETSLDDDNESMPEENDSEIVNELSEADEIITTEFIDMIDGFISNTSPNESSQSSVDSFSKTLENNPLPLDAHDIEQIRKYSNWQDN